MSRQQKARCMRFEKRSQSRFERRRVHGMLEDVKRGGYAEDCTELEDLDMLRAS